MSRSSTFAKLGALPLSVLLISGCTSGSTADGGEGRINLSYGGASQGGAAYQISTAYAEILNSELENVQVDVEVTGGGADNVALLSAGEIEIGHGNSGVGSEAFNGTGDYEGDPLEGLTSWLPLYEYPFQVVVPEDSPIESIPDLAGADIGVNVQGSGGEVTSDQVFSSLGLNRDEHYTPHFLDYPEAASALSLGQIDATVFSSGAPTPQLTELMATMDVRIIEFSAEELDKVNEDYSWLTRGEIPAGTYPDIEEDIPTVYAATINYLSADLPDDLVYNMTKAIWENRDRLANAHATQKNLDGGLIERATLPIMPLHPGARSYLEEEGIIPAQK
ncbi:hypothetical protein BJ994_002862 [Arthrobacter pigmenti]|uniref:TAXI family TRAP transporter solute-binding subunit n=1 Tax=Arthrobacter pigmenti TaxID=271432 RepID=A0A846RXS7_9MICC|nr:TAXI family TRAP transporter solute-binding subunit [Arthrobacter pigmenti]NJC23786.1 hypothetical protein [Arthrobacter pigmenti]